MIKNVVLVQVVSADIPGLFQEMLLKEITASQITECGDLTVRFFIKTNEYPILEAIVQKRGDHIKSLRRSGLGAVCGQIIRRPVFVFGIFILLVLTLFLPTRVLFVQVEGNNLISQHLILRTAEECGIKFGASREHVRSEHVKNNLLNALPQLQWAGINTYGCVAVVSVKEKSEVTDMAIQRKVSSIISAADGVITECTVRKGTAHCTVGDAVRTGQLLVSGYTDCDIKVQAGTADAEIFAQTIRYVETILPDYILDRAQILNRDKKISLLIGKKQINLYNDSGISDSTCVKMYSRKYMTLPGGLRLPIAMITVEYYYFSTCETTMTHDQGSKLLEESAHDYLLTQMSAGQIMQTDTVILHEEDRYRLTGAYFCTEMIGRSIFEESLYTNGQDY